MLTTLSATIGIRRIFALTLGALDSSSPLAHQYSNFLLVNTLSQPYGPLLSPHLLLLLLLYFLLLLSDKDS